MIEFPASPNASNSDSQYTSVAELHCKALFVVVFVVVACLVGSMVRDQSDVSRRRCSDGCARQVRKFVSSSWNALTSISLRGGYGSQGRRDAKDCMHCLECGYPRGSSDALDCEHRRQVDEMESPRSTEIYNKQRTVQWAMGGQRLNLGKQTPDLGQANPVVKQRSNSFSASKRNRSRSSSMDLSQLDQPAADTPEKLSPEQQAANKERIQRAVQDVLNGKSADNSQGRLEWGWWVNTETGSIEHPHSKATHL